MEITAIDSDFLQQELKLTAAEATITGVFPVGQGNGQIGAVYCVKTIGNSYIIKLSPNDDSLWYAWLSKMRPFRREAEAYTFLLPDFSLLGGAIPKCFWSGYSRDGGGMIVLENLLIEGSFMKSVTDDIGIAHCKSALSVAAKIHSLHAVRANDQVGHRRPRQWMFSGRSRVLREIFRQALHQAASLIGEHPGSTVSKSSLHYVRKINIGSVLARAHLHSTLVSFCHGDLWLNNVIFVKRGNSPKPCVIDWQFASWGNPMVDVSFFLVSSLSPGKRLRNTRSLVQFYYSELMKQSPALDYTLEECVEDYEGALGYGLMMTIASLEAFITSNPPGSAGELIRKSLCLADELSKTSERTGVPNCKMSRKKIAYE